MNIRSLTIMTLVLALLAAGAAPALAGAGPWSGGEGQPEPSTTYDTPEYMQQEANTLEHSKGVAERIYFNGFVLNRGQGTNLEGGSIRTSWSTFAAMLGYWRDCNGDGYIGAKNAPTPYGNWNSGSYPRDVYDVDTQLCPPGSPYNQYTFIDEFRWIGPDAAATGGNPNCNPTDWTMILGSCLKNWRDPADVSDADAKVWADFNRPDARAARTGSFTPGYMTQNSSGTLEYVNWFIGIDDDLEEHRNVTIFSQTILEGTDFEQDVPPENLTLFDDSLVAPGTWENKPNFGHCDGATDDQFMSGDKFLDTTGTCGLYPLWQADRLQNDSRSDEEEATPIVQVYDTENDNDESGSACDDTQFGDLKTADLQPTPHSNPLMRGSVGGTRDNVEEGTGNLGFDGKCGGADPNGGGSGSEPRTGKSRVDARLYFAPDKRSQLGAMLGVDYVPMDTLGLTGGPTGPSPWGGDYILFATSSGPRWLGTPSYITTGVPRGYLGPDFATFYADVSPEAFENTGTGASPAAALPAGVQDAHTYGSLQCNNDFSDTDQNREANEEYGWICSSAEWYNENWNTQYVPGMSYDFRDVDCHDTTVMTGLEWNDIENADGDTLRQSCEDWRVNAGPGITTPS